MKNRHLLSISDLSPQDIQLLINRAQVLKEQTRPNILSDQSVALLFEKPSLRTKVSFDIAVEQLGGHCVYLGKEEVGLGVRESPADVAKVMSRYVNALVVRTYAQSVLENLAKHSSIPVINALSDEEHPCQALADLLTIYENKGKLTGINVTYVGDGNNVAASLAIAAASVGINISIASPVGYELPINIAHEIQRRAQDTNAQIKIGNNPLEMLRGADVIYTDVWVSMGQETETKERLQSFEKYRVDEDLLAIAGPNAVFMHPLPAHPGEEISLGMLDHPQSIVFDQAENRLHIQKAILAEILG